MRRPRALWRDLGAAGFLGFQVLFLGAITSYLALPLFWAAWLAGAGFGLAIWQVGPGLAGARLRRVDDRRAGGDARHRRRRGARRGASRAAPWVAALPFYWPLGAVAAWRAMAEIFTRPSFWHKTEHGVSEQA